MTDYSKGRLHCCGGHGSQADSDRPTGLELVLGDSGVIAYGTGDNVDSACILLTDARPDQTETAASAPSAERRVMQRYADVLARGANITVLVPDMAQFRLGSSSAGPTCGKRLLYETTDEGRTGEVQAALDLDAIARFAGFLKTSMQVKFLGLLIIAHRSDLAAEVLKLGADPALLGNLRCIALTCATADLPFADRRVPFLDGLLLPLAVVDLREPAEDEGPVVGETSSLQVCDAPVLQRLTTLTAPRSFAKHAVEHGGHHDVTRELVYWLKKHLHDWS